jgi:hypothetical protein
MTVERTASPVDVSRTQQQCLRCAAPLFSVYRKEASHIKESMNTKKQPQPQAAKKESMKTKKQPQPQAAKRGTQL